MKTLFYCLASTIFAILMFVRPAQAQVVIGPGIIQAPFVRIQFQADGVTHIQAPFVNLYTPTPRYDSTTDDCLQTTNLPADRRQIAEAAGDLRESLTRFNTGPQWQHYFGLSRGEALSSRQLQASESAADTAGMAVVLNRFETIGADDQYKSINTLPAFRRTQELLAAYITQRQPIASPEELPLPPQPYHRPYQQSPDAQLPR
jgi:hypothetical protein